MAYQRLIAFARAFEKAKAVGRTAYDDGLDYADAPAAGVPGREAWQAGWIEADMEHEADMACRPLRAVDDGT